MKQRLFNIIMCWDFTIALVVTIILFFSFPKVISGVFAKDIYGTGLTVLSILFSIYFAALAIIISSSSDDFVLFMENGDGKEGKLYRELLFNFKYSMITTFSALIVSICLYFQMTFILLGHKEYQQPKFYVSFYIFVSLYSLFTVLNSTLDAIKYSEKRVEFLKNKRDLN